MKKQTLIISLILFVWFLYQCSPSDENSSANHLATKEAASSADTLGNKEIVPDTLSYQFKDLKKALSECEGEECTKVEVVYPYFLPGEQGLSAIINEQLNAVISEMLSGYQPDDEIPSNATLDMLAQGFIDQYLQAVEEYGEERPWAIEIKGEVIYQDEEVLSVAFLAYDYMGGVHPNSAQRNVCINLNSGNLWMLEELITDYDQLTDLAEKAFRKEKGLSEQDEFSAAGYNFPDNTFTLNENFMLTEEGIVFHYDPYEIAPYALGHTDVFLSYEELGMMRK